MAFEHHKQRVAPFSVFLKRVARFGLFALLLIIISVGVGTIGYRHFAHLGWVDSFYIACMILTGMGPVGEMRSDSAKLFSSFYALYSGVAFLSICAVFFTPIIHRFLHRLHVAEEE
jgi:hypothetical protein